MRIIIELPSHWSAPQVVAILDLLELLHSGLRDHYDLAIHEALDEDFNHHHDLADPELDDDIPF